MLCWCWIWLIKQISVLHVSDLNTCGSASVSPAVERCCVWLCVVSGDGSLRGCDDDDDEGEEEREERDACSCGWDRSHGERLQRTERRCVPQHLDTVQSRWVCADASWDTSLSRCWPLLLPQMMDSWSAGDWTTSYAAWWRRWRPWVKSSSLHWLHLSSSPDEVHIN